jgi:hypothetical protein
VSPNGAYRDYFAGQAEGVCKLGASNANLAALFGCTVDTIEVWLRDRQDFREAVHRGRADYDSKIEQALARRAMGYERKAQKAYCNTGTGEVFIAEYEEHYPAEVNAAIFWLKNRQPQRWRDRQEVTLHAGRIESLTDDELERIASGGRLVGSGGATGGSVGVAEAEGGAALVDGVHNVPAAGLLCGPASSDLGGGSGAGGEG